MRNQFSSPLLVNQLLSHSLFSNLKLMMVVALIVMGSVSSAVSVDEYGAEVYVLPSILVIVTKLALYALLTITSLWAAIGVKRHYRYFLRNHKWVALAYFIMFLWSIPTEGQLKYILFFISVTFIPLFVADTIESVHFDVFLKVLLCTFFFLEILTILNALRAPDLAFIFGRLRGITGNANQQSIMSIYWIAMGILGTLYYRKSYFSLIIMILGIIFVIMTGSRNGLAMIFMLMFSLLIVLPTLRQKILLFTIGCVALIAASIYLSQQEIGLIERIMNLGDAVEDSGRGTFWETAWSMLVFHSPYLGFGMESLELLGLPKNVSLHNSYLTILFYTGFIVGSFLIFLIVAGMLKYLFFSISKEYKNVGLFLALYLMIYLISSFGENFLMFIGGIYAVHMFITMGILAWLKVHHSQQPHTIFDD